MGDIPCTACRRGAACRPILPAIPPDRIEARLRQRERAKHQLEYLLIRQAVCLLRANEFSNFHLKASMTAVAPSAGVNKVAPIRARRNAFWSIARETTSAAGLVVALMVSRNQ